jgi:hypothetical protein
VEGVHVGGVRSVIVYFSVVCEDIIDRRTDRHVILVAG